jgi:hypothetical protein
MTTTTSAVNPDIKQIGPGLWHLLHTSACAVKTEANIVEFEKILDLVKKTIKCDECRNDLQTFIDKNPIKNYLDLKSTRTNDIVGVYVWTFKLHNHVNAKLNKPIADLEQTYKYFSNNSPVCFACLSSRINKLDVK